MDSVSTDGRLVSERAFADALLAFCTPAMYAENPYRLSGLDADASSQEVRRAADRLELEVALGAMTAAKDPLGRRESRDPVEVHHAIARLSDPLARALFGYFWFWRDPAATPSAPDPAIAALSIGDVSRARALWENRLAFTENSRVVAMHNLAVLAYARALEAERDPREGDQHGNYVRSWREALMLWRDVSENMEYWRFVAKRIERIADPRLPAETANYFQRFLPVALAQPHAYLLREAAEAGDQERVRQHRMIMADSGCGDAGITECIGSALTALIDQLRVIVDEGNHIISAGRRNGIWSYIQRIELLLTTLGSAMAERVPAFRIVRDEAVELALSVAIEYGSSTNDWAGALKAVERTAKLPTFDSVSERVGREVRIARNDIVGILDPTAAARNSIEDDRAGVDELENGDALDDDRGDRDVGG